MANIDASTVNYSQGGSGAIVRTVDKKLQDFISVKDFGATGDGITDDTGAISVALASSSKQIYFPPGTYLIVDPRPVQEQTTPLLISNVAGRKISFDGKLTANASMLRCLGIYGDNSIIQVNIDGNDLVAHGLSIYGSQCIVEHCVIENLKTLTFSCIGIEVNNISLGTIIRNNIIRRCNAVGDGKLETPNGYCRGIAITMDRPATAMTIIENNLIEDILGEQGDSITILSLSSGTYQSSKAIIRNNTIDTFSRRAIKTQGNDNFILNNYIRSKFQSADDVPNRQAVISLIQGGDQHIIGNTFDGCNFFPQISVFSEINDSYNNFYIEDNKIVNLTAVSDETIIFTSPRGKNVVIKNNEIQCTTGTVISVGGVEDVLVAGNRISCSDNTSRPAINFTASVLNGVLKDNILINGLRQCFVESIGPGMIVCGNINRTNSPFFRDQNGNHNSLVTQNILDGSGLLYSNSQSLIGNQISQNHAIGQQTNSAPADLIVGSGGPAISLTGIWVSAGTKAWTRSPTAGGKAGWVALATGLAESIVWKPFGQIDT